MIVESSHIDLPTPSGGGGGGASTSATMRVHIHEPARASGPERSPTLVLYPEIYQETAPIRRAALRFAGQGYLVAVPEIFHEHEPPGTALTYDTEGTEKGNRYKYATALATYDADIRAAIDLVRDHPRGTGKVGVVGFCLGGHLALRAALSPYVIATACFYPTDIQGDTLGAGKASDTKARMKEIHGELLMVFGRQDPHVPDEGRRVIYDALAAANVRFSWHEVNAVHAFMRDEGPRFDPTLAALGYALALEMFERTLKRP